MNSSYSDDILLIMAPEVLEVKTTDNAEPLVDIRDYKNIILDKKTDWRSDQYYMVRKTVAQKLESAALSLPDDMKILFKEGHRSIAKQKEIYDWFVGVLKERHPEKQHEEICTLATEWVSKPIEGAPHSTGAAFDVTLADKSGKEIDMGSVVDDTSRDGVSKNKTYSSAISEKGRKNRAILIETLESQGFQNYPFEWWHWSYGDKYWAYHQKTNAIYNSIK